MADAGYVTIFEPGDKGVAVYDEKDVCINLSGEAILRGCQDHRGLWRIPLPCKETPGRRSAPLQGDALRIRYLHACLGFPTKATWLAAIRRGNFVGWPLVTVANVNGHFPECDETPMGHLNQQRQGVRSTKRPAADFEPVNTTLTAGKKAKDIYVKIYDAHDF
ncbi:hypothetical protein ACHAWF_000207 [Thalassiosira exigua]